MTRCHITFRNYGTFSQPKLVGVGIQTGDLHRGAGYDVQEEDGFGSGYVVPETKRSLDSESPTSGR
jgi:hypothetical protein